MSAARARSLSRRRLFRRLRQAREPRREPPRSSARDQSKRQARGRGRDPRARQAHSHSGFQTEAASVSFIKSRVAKGTELMADEANSWNELHASTRCCGSIIKRRIAHNGACTNGAEEFFSRMRRAEIGHIIISPTSILSATLPSPAWRDYHRRLDNGGSSDRSSALVAKNKPSVDFCGYWQRSSSPKTPQPN